MAMSREEAILQATIDGTEYSAKPLSRVEKLLLDLKEVIEGGGGGGGGATTAEVLARIKPVDTAPLDPSDGMTIMWCDGTASETFKVGGVYIYDASLGSWVSWYEPIPLDTKADLVNGKVPAAQLPSYVDDVVEGYYYDVTGKFYEEDTYITEIIPERSKIYIDLSSDDTYRWGGSVYVPVGPSADGALTKNVTSNVAVGAIASGTTLQAATTFTEFVEKLLISEIAPTVAFSISKSGNVAAGGSYTETLTLNVTNIGTAKKIKNIKWYSGSTLLDTTDVDSSAIISYTYTMETPTTSTTTFKAIVEYQKSDDSTGTIEKTASISFYYNKFYGSVASLTPDEATVEALTTALATGKGGTYKYTVSAARIAYAYPSSLGALTSIKDGNGFSLFDSFTRTTETYTQAGASVSYYLYVLTDPTTVSNYNVTFA